MSGFIDILTGDKAEKAAKDAAEAEAAAREKVARIEAQGILDIAEINIGASARELGIRADQLSDELAINVDTSIAVQRAQRQAVQRAGEASATAEERAGAAKAAGTLGRADIEANALLSGAELAATGELDLARIEADTLQTTRQLEARAAISAGELRAGAIRDAAVIEAGTIRTLSEAEANAHELETGGRALELIAAGQVSALQASLLEDQAARSETVNEVNRQLRQRQVAQLIGAQRAAQAASGGVVDSGSGLEVTADDFYFAQLQLQGIAFAEDTAVRQIRGEAAVSALEARAAGDAALYTLAAGEEVAGSIRGAGEARALATLEGADIEAEANIRSGQDQAELLIASGSALSAARLRAGEVAAGTLRATAATRAAELRSLAAETAAEITATADAAATAKRTAALVAGQAIVDEGVAERNAMRRTTRVQIDVLNDTRNSQVKQIRSSATTQADVVREGGREVGQSIINAGAARGEAAKAAQQFNTFSTIASIFAGFFS